MLVPEGFSVVTPYIFAADAELYIAFLSRAFGAVETRRSVDPTGQIAYSQMRLATATIMISDATPEYPATKAAFYLYVEDADAAMTQALGAGAKLLMDAADMPYGDRQGGVSDPQGNIWWISQRLTAEPYF